MSMKSNVCIQTFGAFEVLADGQKVIFHNSKSKEVLAILVDKYGLSLSRAEISSVVWGDQVYDRIMQQRLNSVIRSMRSTLAGYGIDSIFEMKKGNYYRCHLAHSAIFGVLQPLLYYF